MARTRASVNKEELMKAKQREIKNYLIALLVILFVIISFFRFGNAGYHIDSFFKDIFGTIPYYLIFIQIAIYCFYILYKGKTLKVSSRYIIGPILFNVGIMILLGSIDATYIGFYSLNREIILTSSLGYLQVLLFGVFSYLFSFAGARLFAVLFIIGGIIVFKRVNVSDLLISTSEVVSDTSVKVKDSIVQKVETHREQSANRVKKTPAFKDFFKDHKDENLQLTSPIDLSTNEDTQIIDEVPYDSEYLLRKEKASGIYHVEDLRPTLSDIEAIPFDIDDLDLDIDYGDVDNIDLNETEIKIKKKLASSDKDYKLPSFDLLNNPYQNDSIKLNTTYATKQAKALTEFLATYNIAAQVVKTVIGPSVTKFYIQLDKGVRVKSIETMANDIKLNLAVKQLRVEAPIPGEPYVGIEIPNIKNNLVTLKEVLDKIDYKKENKLVFGIGKDINDQAIYTSLDKMPHLLIAGSTGSGKSVMINSIIISLLMNATYNEVKLLMIDPKKVELSVYNDIPHLLTPVIDDPKAASIALKRLVVEMENRYRLMSESKTKTINDHNAYVEAFNKRCKDEDLLMDRIPYIVIVIDELADLMLVAKSEVEDSINRIAALARASGIFLVVATQRPSVDVLTGVIKNNIPSRIAFAVSSYNDSKTILNCGGAESLLGKGDMLYAPTGHLGGPDRIQGAFLSDEEIARVVHSIKAQKIPFIENDIFALPDNVDASKIDNESDDEMYQEVLDYVLTQESISTSKIQREFSFGYNRAANLMDDLERNGIVSGPRGQKPRIVLSNSERED